jgi:hypothetical protein
VADPVSWILIERGWNVVDPNGEKVGRVDEVEGDTTIDIFSGIRILTGLLGKPKLVPAEAVDQIYEGEIRLTLTNDDVDRLPDA